MWHKHADDEDDDINDDNNDNNEDDFMLTVLSRSTQVCKVLVILLQSDVNPHIETRGIRGLWEIAFLLSLFFYFYVYNYLYHQL